MEQRRFTWGKLGLLGALALALYALATLEIAPGAAAGPLAQATATPTPGPAVASLGGVPIYAPHAPNGNNLLGVSCETGCSGSGGSSFPYGAGTAIPVIITPATTPVPYFTQIPVQPIQPNGAVAAQTPVAVQGVAGEAHLGAMGGQNVQVAATMVLPAQTPVAYTALDVMANSASSPVVVTFAGMCRVNGGSGFILKARQTTDQSTNVAAVRWHVFHTAPTAINDNSPFTLLYANASNRVGQIDLPANATEGTGSNAAHAINADVRLAYKCAGGDTALYMIPETLTSFTPASAQGWTFELSAAIN